jgi:S-DNA-T family DNA segregation ATPase FtsK/SpoIIIE
MSSYKQYTPDELQELFSQFLTDSWSYSKVTTFARNEKAFEMNYIYGIRGKSSATTLAGNAYHEAVANYFISLKEGTPIDIVECERIAFDYITNTPANYLKLQKTTPTVDECKAKATQSASVLLKNFFGELPVYTESLAEVIGVEMYLDEWITVNGVDIPLPCHAKIDLAIKTDEGKVCLLDHKSKASYTPDDEIAMSIGVQAITYVLAFEEKTGIEVDEVWFVENKTSVNRDGSKQLQCFKVEIDNNTRRLYEALLYEPLRRMVQAVSDPDYIYMINDSDNFVDRAELYDFWAKTMICEVEEFNVPEAKKELISQRLKKVRDASIKMVSPSVIKKFKENASQFIQYDLSNKDMSTEEKIEHVLRSFGIISRVAHKFNGYSSSTFLLEVSAGVKIASIYSHRLDIANALDTSSVRIGSDLYVYENKSYVSVEFSNKTDSILAFDPEYLSGRKIPIGKDNMDNLIYWDLDNPSTPHVLICGATGSGKSVSIKSTIEYAKLTGPDRIVVFDPKFEFVGLPGVEVYNHIEDIENQMGLLVEEMNQLTQSGRKKNIIVFFDEFADALSASRSAKDLKVYDTLTVGNYADGRPKTQRVQTGELKSLEENLRILLQKGRSIGFRIVAATQRASVKVIGGDAKVNFPIQICFRVPKETDSRVVLDEAGAESLSGKGDGLIKSPQYSQTVRFQGIYI